MGRNPTSGGTAFRFTTAEVAIMDQALQDSAYATPARSIVEGLAAQFSNSPERVGQRPVASKQVWNWFQNRRHALKAKMEKLKAIAAAGGETPSAPKVATVAGTSIPKKVEVAMDFEAKSARDGAWYDVSAFIDKRKLDTSEPEVKVRFAGFGSEEDEWVNIANAVRQRSLPCETTECVAVLPGDLILCFQEGSEQALYFDADILDVQRRRHDVRGCRCRFWVRYRHDQTEEVVPLRKVCRRPETEQRLQQAREANAASNRLANSESVRALNGTPSTRTASQIPPTTPATPTQLLISAFNATPNPYTSTSNLYTPVEQGTSTPGLEPMQPISMQLMSTPVPKPPIFQQTVPPPAAPTHSTGVLEGAAVSPSQVPAPSMPIGSQSTTTQQSFPSIESSISRQLNISVPHQQTPPISTGAGPNVFGDAAGAPVVKPNVSGVSEQPIVVSTGLPEPGDLSQPVGKLGIAKPSVVGPTSTADVEAAETSNRAESMEGVNLTLAVNLAGPPSAPLGSSAEVGLSSDSSAANTSIKEKQSPVSKDLPITSVDGSTSVGDAAVPPVSPSASTLPST